MATTLTRQPSAPFEAAISDQSAPQRLRLSVPRGETLVIIGLMCVGLVAQAFNMFHYPAFTFGEDEGRLMAQAGSMLSQQRLSPYTFVYDAPPGGTFLLSAWALVSGGLHTFGDAIAGGRILMLLLHVAMIALLYRVCRKLGCAPSAAVFTTLLFSLSPLALFYQRMVSSETMTLFWILLSLDLLLDGWGRLSRVGLSGAAFGLALLTHEFAFVLIPVMVFLAIQQRWRHQGRFAVIGWLLPMVMMYSFYPLYALLKTELFPNIGPETHASLIGGLATVFSRDGSGLFNLNNDFWRLLRDDWVRRDAFLLGCGTLAVAINLVRGVRNRPALAGGLLGLLSLLTLAFGYRVGNTAILFALPFLCLNIALLWTFIGLRMSVLVENLIGVLIVAALLTAYTALGSTTPLYSEQPDTAGRAALQWIEANVPTQSYVVSRDDLWIELRQPQEGNPAFPHVYSHVKVATDPEIRNNVFNNDWHGVDYLLMTPTTPDDFRTTNNTIALAALAHAHLVKRWTAASGDQQLHPQQIIELWKVDKSGIAETNALTAAQNSMLQHFDFDGAYIVAGKVTAEVQAAAMLRAVWSSDQGSFRRIWGWTQSHMLTSDGRLEAINPPAATERYTVSDANSDAALALLMAGKRWNDPTLIEAGKRMVGAIWQREVVTVNGQPYIAAGDWATQGQIIAFNSGAFTPYAYRIFKEVDPTHDWSGLIDTGYQTLQKGAAMPVDGVRSAGLPPDWIGIDRTTGNLVALPRTDSKEDSSRYGYDAARAYWRVGLDLKWSGDARATAFLSQAQFLDSEVRRTGSIGAVYGHDGTPVVLQPSLVGVAGAVAALLQRDPDVAQTLYAAQISGGFTHDANGAYWGTPTDLNTQQWGWFTTAYYANALPDLWHAR